MLQHKPLICNFRAYITSDMFKQQLFLFGYRSKCVVDSLRGLSIPMRSAPSSGAGCYGDRWHGHARSSSGKAGSRGTADICSENPSCSRSGSRSIPPDGRLDQNEEREYPLMNQISEHYHWHLITDKINTVLYIYICTVVSKSSRQLKTTQSFSQDRLGE